MAIRILKIVLVLFVGLQGWFYVAGNIANWDAGLGAVAYVLGMEGHEIYGTHIFPPITNTTLVTVAFLIIISGEFLVGALSLTGAWHLWQARNGNAASFNSAKTFAILGAGMALVVWFGGFVVIGGALFQMWQTQVGTGSFNGAFIYAATSAFVLLFVNSHDS
jgi:predicted small integral membrane protein